MCWRFTRGDLIRRDLWYVWMKSQSNLWQKSERQSRWNRADRHAMIIAVTGPPICFMAFAPLESSRHVKGTNRRISIDYAHFLADLAPLGRLLCNRLPAMDVHFCKADKIVLVQDNLNTHTPASLYLAFAPQEARRLAERFDWHCTPKHGSWLNMAKIELSVLSRQCLKRRIEDQTTLISEVANWQAVRNTQGAAANWQFTTKDARTKLQCLYPSI